MATYLILDKGTPILRVQANEREEATSVSAVDDGEADDLKMAQEMLEAGANRLMQIIRFFGREATFIREDEYMGRSVTKRGLDDDLLGEEEVTLAAPGEIVKTDPAKQIVFGWAYVLQDSNGDQVVDKSGDFHDDIEDFEETAYNYVLKSRASDADHTNVKGGEMVESIVFTPEKIKKMGLPEGVIPLGWWVGYKITDKPTWERVEKGELTAFSIHGRGSRTPYAED